MRQKIGLAMVVSLVLGLAALAYASTQSREDELAQSIVRLVEKSR